MRNVVMAVMLVAAGVSSSYVNRTGGSDSGTEAVAKGKTPSLEGALPQPIDDPLGLLLDFLDPEYQPAPGPAASCVDPIEKLRDLLNSPQRPCVPPPAAAQKEVNNCDAKLEAGQTPLDLNFMIATIPDPEKTHLGLYFDRFLDAMIFASEEEGFSYDRYWLPWHVNHDPANPDPLKQDILDGRAEARHRKPGAIVFRKSPILSTPNDINAAKEQDRRNFENSRSHGLVIFLVGETPTSGINRRQFKLAADYMKQFSKCSHVLGVLGPTFSGSAPSLRAAMQTDFPRQQEGTLVMSGTVSSRDALTNLANSVVHSDEFLRPALNTFLARQLRIRGNVVFLKEAATDFSVGFLGSSSHALEAIYYPREISRLRNVYPEQTSSAAAQVASLQQQLLLRLRDSRPGEETLPEFSDQTPLTQETVLLQISETLRRDHVGLAILTGTDVLDLLFLSRHLRDLSPDVRILLWDSDLLFIHGTDTLDFTGMLALSTYPLIPANHSWTDGSSSYYYFASNMTQGVYNACRYLFNPVKPNLREYSSPGAEGGSKWPPVWLSIIGQDAYWPLGFVEDPGNDPRLPPVDPPTSTNLDPGWPTRAWSSIFYSCSILSFVYIGLFFYVLQRPLDLLPRWCSFLHPRPYPEAPWRAHYAAYVSLALLCAYLSLLVPVFRLGFHNPHGEWKLMLSVGAAVLAGFLVLLARGFAELPLWSRIPPVALLALLTMFFIHSVHLGRFFNEESFFRALRSVQLGSGVGPNLPIFALLLGLAWWASTQVQRARLVVEHRPQVPDIAANGAFGNIVRLNDWLAQGFLHIDPFGWIVAGAGAAITAVAAIPHVISVEGWLFDAVLCTLLILLATLLFLTTYSFGRVWRALDRLLEALETQPIRFAFSNLPPDVSWSPLWQYGARKKTYTTLIRSLESLRALKKSDKDYCEDLEGELTKFEGDLNLVLEPVHQGVEEQVSTMRQAQDRISGITVKLCAKLSANEWKRDHSESIEKLKKAAGGKTLHEGMANWFHVGKPAELNITSTPEDANPEDKPDLLAAEVVALRYLAYIRYIMRHLRNLLSFITTGFILMTLALNCYPFQMLNLIRWSITIVFVLISVVLFYVFQQMSRNEILRRVTDTPATAIDTGFFTRALSIGALPLLAVVASHFPSVGRFLFSWVQPAISALH